MNTYSNRSIELVTIEKVHDDGRTVTWTNGWTFGGIPTEHQHLLHAGAQFLSETQRLTAVTGMATVYFTASGDPVVDQWLWHKTDVDLEREHTAMVEGFQRQREESLAEHRDDWARREAALPSPLRHRLERFRSNGGDQFDLDGWGYELTVSELAVLYAASGQTDDQAVTDYAETNGTTGNQHSFAIALSRGLTDDPTDHDLVTGAVAALSPLTGDHDYSGAGQTEVN